MQEETENTRLTTIQTDVETSRKLGLIAAAYERSKAAQLRAWVNKEYGELERLKILPKVDAAGEEAQA